jgi:hypothetical protein
MILALAAVGQTFAQQPPTPTSEPACSDVVFQGPGARTLYQVRVDVPAGSYGLSIPPPGVPDMPFVICHVQTGAVLTISGIDCRELSRDAPSSATDAVLDEIVESCEVLPPAAPSRTTPGRPAFCQTGESVPGGRAVTIGNAIEVTLPEGNFVVDASFIDAASVCNPEEGYWLVLRLSDCGRADISPPAPFDVHEPVNRQIQGSCVVLNPGPTPTQPLFRPAAGISPPRTGGAGLANSGLTADP